jgi:hypothetical protein
MDTSLNTQRPDENTPLFHHTPPPSIFNSEHGRLYLKIFSMGTLAILSGIFFGPPSQEMGKCMMSAINKENEAVSPEVMMASAIIGNSLINLFSLEIIYYLFVKKNILKEKYSYLLSFLLALFSVVAGFELNATGFNLFGWKTGNETSTTWIMDTIVTLLNAIPNILGAKKLIDVNRALYYGGDVDTRKVRMGLSRIMKDLHYNYLLTFKQRYLQDENLFLHSILPTTLEEPLNVNAIITQYEETPEITSKEVSKTALAITLFFTIFSRIGLSLTAAFFWYSYLPYLIELTLFTSICTLGFGLLGRENLFKIFQPCVVAILYPFTSRVLGIGGILLSLLTAGGVAAATLKGWAWALNVLDINDPCYLSHTSASSIYFIIVSTSIAYFSSAIISNMPLILTALQSLQKLIIGARHFNIQEIFQQENYLIQWEKKIDNSSSKEILSYLATIQDDPHLLEILSQQSHLPVEKLTQLAQHQHTGTVSGYKQAIDTILLNPCRSGVSLFVSSMRNCSFPLKRNITSHPPSSPSSYSIVRG